MSLAALLAGLHAGAAAQQPELLQGVRQRLAQPAWLQGQFEQSKQVQGFKQPLRSQGEFVVARGRGVLWRTLRPFASELRLTSREIITSQGGQRVTQVDVQQEPALRLVNSMMLALLAGDVTALDAQFQVRGALRAEQGWILELTPRQEAWRQMLQSITMQGDRLVREVSLTEASGDITKIRFTQLRETAPDPVPKFD
ncbi:outer membrane lipoprotein carrier protein LolA [Roseateles sp. BYS180W]|uniref:Outer membrane lipoprotein carrier protein LolA n=1 Tax=Roseateles rivi TaxID=3299028 RepID=A0ABW7FR07_9BURK